MTARDQSPSANKVKVSVLGTGSLGKEHVRIYAELAAAGRVEFVGVHDTVSERARKFAEKYRVRAFGSVAEAAEASDALNIVTPTTTHFELAKALLQQRKHVLVEKPMTDDAAQASELCQLALENRCVLQVGHVERFNPVFTYLEKVATDPRFIEVHRLSPYPARSTDIGVVLDLMIHDLDVVLAFVKSPVSQRRCGGNPGLEQVGGYRQCAAAFRQRLPGELDGEPDQPGEDAKDTGFQRRVDDELYLARLPGAGRIYYARGPGGEEESSF